MRDNEAFRAEINIKWIYYSSNSRNHLPINHSLAGKQTDVSIENIYGNITKLAAERFKVALGIEDLLHLQSLKPIITKTVLNLRSFQVSRMGKSKNFDSAKNMKDLTSCSLRIEPHEIENLLSFDNNVSREDPVPPIFKHAVPWKRVKATVFYIIKTVVPLDLFGSNGNRRKTCQFVNLVLSNGKGDTISLNLLLNKLDLSKMRWLDCVSTSEQKFKIAGSIFYWLLQSVILSLIQVMFFITETSSHKNQMFFFKKNCWQQLRDKELNHFCASGRMKTLKRSEAKQLIVMAKKKCVSYVTGSLRFIPKPNGLRPVLQCAGAEMSTIDSKIYPIFLRLISHHLFGPHISDTVPFNHQWRTIIPKIRKFTEVYVVKVDIKDAYGSILQNVLIELIQDGAMFLGSHFHVMEFTRKLNTRTFSRKAFYLPVSSDGTPILRDDEDSSQFIPRSNIKTIDVKTTIKKLIQLISCQLVQVTTNQYALLKQGVAQGAKVSSAFCDLYYSAVYRKHLTEFNAENSCLLRSVDDFMLISCHKDCSTSFLNRMCKGFAEFSCFINPSKTFHNLNGDPIRVSFRGYSFCSSSKDILIDLSSLGVNDPRYSLKVRLGGDFEIICQQKLRQISKARWPSMLSSPLVISKQGVARNIYRLGISLMSRLAAVVRTFSMECETVKEFLFLELKKLCAKLWNRVSMQWKESLFSRDLFMYLFFRGVIGVSCANQVNSFLFPFQIIVNCFLSGKYAKLGSEDHSILLDLKIM